MIEDEVERQFLSLHGLQAAGTILPAFLLEKLEDCLALEITETDLHGLGADSSPGQLEDAVLAPISASGA